MRESLLNSFSKHPRAVAGRGAAVWRALGAIVALWVLTAAVYGEFRNIRVKVARETLPPQASVSVPIAPEITDPVLVLVARMRNDGHNPVRVDVRVGARTVARLTLPPGTSRRVDAAWTRAPTARSEGAIELVGAGGNWTLDYAELANLHGFTRGAIDFLVLPAGQPFTRAPAWLFVGWAAWAWLFISMPGVARGRRPPLAYLTVAFIVAAFFGLLALAPIVSAFHIVLAPHTYVGCLLVIAAVPLWAAGVRAARLLTLTPAAVRFLVTTGERRMRSLVWPGVLRDRSYRIAATLAQKTRQCGVASVAAFARLPWFWIFMIAAAAAYTSAISPYVGTFAGGSDSSGYLNSARLLEAGRVRIPMRLIDALPVGTAVPQAYLPLGFQTATSDSMVPTYPIGLPLLVAGFAQLSGWEHAGDWVMLLHTLAGLAVTFLLGRECGLGRWAAALAAWLLATSPLYLFMSITLMSDTPALVWTTATLLFAWKSRVHPGMAWLAGLAAALAVLIRPTNVLVLAAAALCLGLSARRWLLFGFGGLPGAAILIWYNLQAYGRAITTGYGDFSDFFRLSHVLPTWGHYATWLPVLLTPVGVLALGLPWLRRRHPQLGWALLTWTCANLIFYSFYFYTREAWWFTRFLLPVFPPLLVAAVWTGRLLIERVGTRVAKSAIPRSRPALWLLSILLVAGIAAHNAWWGRRLHVLSSGRGEQRYLEVAEWSKRHLPPTAAILTMQASGALFYYTEFPIVRFDWLDERAADRLLSYDGPGARPLYAVLFPVDIMEFRAFEHLPGKWIEIGKVEDITIWQFDGLGSDRIGSAGGPPAM